MSYISGGGGGGGGGGTPGGSTTDVQINLAGSFYGDAGFTYNPATGVVTVGGLLNNQIAFEGAASGFASIVEAFGSDASVPIWLKPKGSQGFVQLGPDTYGAGGWGGYNLSAEILRYATTEQFGAEIYVETYIGDITSGNMQALSFVAGTQGVGATQDVDYIFGITGLAQSLLLAGRTITQIKGGFFQVQGTAGGHVGTAAGLTSAIYNTSGADGTGTSYAYNAYFFGPIVNRTLDSYGFWCADMAGVSVNPYYDWYDSQGVRRTKEDSTFDSVGQAIEALYNPQFTKYTPGAANFERVILGQWDGNVAEIGNEAGGTGTLRALRLLGSSVLFPSTGDSIITSGYIHVANNKSIYFDSRSGIRSLADGNLTLLNFAENSFGLLQFGGTSSSFPAIKRSSAVIQARLADDSGFALLQGLLQTAANAVTALTPGVLAATTNASLVLTDASGQAYRVPCII